MFFSVRFVVQSPCSFSLSRNDTMTIFDQLSGLILPPAKLAPSIPTFLRISLHVGMHSLLCNCFPELVENKTVSGS